VNANRALLYLALANIESRFTMKRTKDGSTHLRDCRISQWVDGYGAPNGAPCSVKCVQDHALAFAIRLHLAAEHAKAEPRQMELREAS
jgi:hypothetical protein